MNEKPSVINLQIEKIRRACFELTLMLPYDKIRVEYNNNKKIRDEGKIEIMPIFSNVGS